MRFNVVVPKDATVDDNYDTNGRIRDLRASCDEYLNYSLKFFSRNLFYFCN